jgi:hypothetical protein
LILSFRIEGDQPFGLSRTEKALVGGNQDEVVAVFP